MKQKLHVKMFLVLAFLLVQQILTQAQVSINYPAGAQVLTRGTGQSNLIVQLGFTAACTGTTVTIALPPSVSYVAGSVTKTAGSLAGSNITESNISNLNAPVFALSGITAAGDITFTIARQAGCGNLASGKDTVKVNSTDCGTAIENNASTNTYNILTPALSLTPPAALSNAVLGSTATPTIKVTNGGNGDVDTLRFYIVYTNGGIVNTTGTNTITANGVNFIPSSNNGDTLFYKIYGATIFGGNNLLSNGETVTITEPVRVAKCNTTTAYGASWGNKCQVATGTSAVTMANGVTDGTVTATRPTNLLPCTPGTIRINYNATGSGGAAGAIFHINPGFGRSDGGGGNTFYTSGPNVTYVTFSNFLLNGIIPITATYTAGRYKFTLNFTTDPDGAGVGLEDLDGDGYYNDLLPGQSFYILATQTITFPPECDNSAFATIVLGDMYYKSMCSVPTDSTRKAGGVNGPNTGNNGLSVVKPGVVYGGQSFTVRTCVDQPNPSNFADYSSTADSSVMEIQLPAGISYVAGSTKYNNAVGVSTPTVTVTGSTIQIRKNGRESFCLDYDLVYTCGASGEVKIPYKFYFVHDRSCGAIQYYKCDTVKVSAVCPGPCTVTTGVNNIAASKVARTRYGWTNNTMTTPVDTATLSALSKKTAILYDTINVKQSGMQIGSVNNLYYTALIDKVGSTDMFDFAGGNINYKPAGSSAVSCALPAPTITVVGAQTKYVWNLTGLSCLPATFNNNDSMWVDMNYILKNAPSTGVLTQPSSNAYFYNVVSAAESYCASWPLDVYVISSELTGLTNNAGSATIFTGCSGSTLTIRTYRNLSNGTFDNFPNEFRPSIMKDSIIVTLPVGYSWTGGSCTLGYESFGATLQNVTISNFTLASPVVVGQKLIFKNPGNWPMSDVALIGNRGYDVLAIPLIANCQAFTGTQGITLRESGIRYFYAGINQPYALENNSVGGNLLLSYANKPAVTVQNNTGTVQGVLSQQYWDVQVNNPSTQTAPYLWLALEKSSGSGGISIDSVVLKPSNVILTAATYNSTDKWYQVSTAGLTTGSTQQARVYFKYSSCTADSILLKSGWNCTGYPSPDPLTGYACTAAQTYLKVIPQPSQVQLNILRQPGAGDSISLCNTDSALVVINSAQAGNLITPYVNVYPPAGVTIQLPVQVEYPLGSGNYQNTTATAIPGGYKLDITTHTGIGTNGLPGTVINPGTAGRQAKLKVEFTTTCGITSGSPLSFEPYGTQPCGAAAIGNGVAVQTAGINITGASTPGGAGITMGVGASSISCGMATTLTLSTTPVITPTQTGDTVTYTIPAGLLYNGNFTGAGFAAVVTTAAGPGGTTLVKIPLPAGVAAGTVINYSFDVVAGGIGGCGNVNILASAKRDIAPLMCGGVACTSSTVVIGTATSAAITLNKPSLSTSNFTFTENLATSPRVVDYSIKITNTGTQAAAAGAYLVKIYCGTNNTGKVLATFTANAVGIGATITQTGSFTYAAYTDCAKGSALFMQIQDTTAAGVKVCLCSSPAGSLSAQVLPVKLLAFTGTANNCNATLSWTTTEETNFNHFEVEQSTDAVSFAKIATVASKHNSNGSAYAGLYSQPQKLTYYRLRMVDNNGAITFSNIIFVKTNCTTGFTIAVYPNPVKDIITVTGLSGQTELRLVNVLGQVLTTVSTFNSTQQLDVSKYPAATYMLQVIQNNTIVKNIKLIKE